MTVSRDTDGRKNRPRRAADSVFSEGGVCRTKRPGTAGWPSGSGIRVGCSVRAGQESPVPDAALVALGVLSGLSLYLQTRISSCHLLKTKRKAQLI